MTILMSLSNPCGICHRAMDLLFVCKVELTQGSATESDKMKLWLQVCLYFDDP